MDDYVSTSRIEQNTSYDVTTFTSEITTDVPLQADLTTDPRLSAEIIPEWAVYIRIGMSRWK